MGSFASRLLLALAVIGGQAAPMFADEASSLAALPAFVSQNGRANYSEAVNGTKSKAQARRAAEALSAKFSDITTSSISKNDEQPPLEIADPQNVEPKEAGRSIVLAASGPEDPKKSIFEATDDASGPAPKTRVPVHRIPRRVIAKTSGPRPAPSAGPTTSGTLASVGQKVGFIDLLTNPALWHWTPGAHGGQQ